MEINEKNNIIIKAIEDKKGENIKIYNVNNSICDYVIIATALNDKNAEAISANVIEKLEENNLDYKNIEGKNTHWIIIDSYDVIIHIFSSSEREHFDLDSFLETKK